MEQIVVALDLGSSKLKACVSHKNFDKLSVLHTETLSPEETIRRGRVFNLDGASDIISKLIQKLNNRLPSPVEKMYVGIGGQSLHTKLFSVKRVIESGNAISQQLLESMKEEAIRYKPEWEENLGVFSDEYYLDGQLVSNPKGALASVIEAKFQLVVGNPSLKGNLKKVFDKKNMTVAGYFISPIATAEAVLTPREKELGCALVELGDEITYVSVYKNKALKYIIALPIGGLAITKDIRSLNVSEAEAEALKIKHGSAVLKSIDKREIPVNEEQSSSRRIELHSLNEIVEARVDEIIRNVWNQIQESGYAQSIDAGIVITGGGALLRDLPAYIQDYTGEKVRLAKAKVWENQNEILLSPAFSCVVGLTIMGKENCVKGQKPKKKGRFSFFNSKPTEQTPFLFDQTSFLFDMNNEAEEEAEAEEEEKKPKKEPKKEQKEKPLVSSDSRSQGGSIKKITHKVGEMFEKGSDGIFKETDFYHVTNTPTKKETSVIHFEDEEVDNY